jgi:hypothetical protein
MLLSPVFINEPAPGPKATSPTPDVIEPSAFTPSAVKLDVDLVSLKNDMYMYREKNINCVIRN